MKFIGKLSDSKLWDDINWRFENRGGSYILFSKNDNEVRPISRALGKDPSGTLYVGKADCFLDRVINLKKSLSPNYKSGNHICGRRYKKMEKFVSMFPFETLYVELTEHSNPEELERIRLENYVQEFGEVPPLNAY